MRKYVQILCLLMFGYSITIGAQSKEDGWIKIGEKYVAFHNETDDVKLSGSEKDVTKIKIKCVQGAVKIKKISVKMSDGSTKDYDPATGILKDGMSTMNFDLPGKDNTLKDLKIEYDSMGTIATNKRAKVEIWGKKKKDDD